MWRKASLILVLALGPCTFALAQSGTPQEQAACRPDVARHCRGIGGEQGAVLNCLVSHAQRLSSRCRHVLESHGQLPRW